MAAAAVTLDVEPQLDHDAAEKLAEEIRARVKQAVLDGMADAVLELAAVSGLLAGNVGDAAS